MEINKIMDIKSLDVAQLRTVEECDTALEICFASLTACKQQLAEAQVRAKSTGRYPDAKWFGRLNGARGVYAAIQHKIQLHRAALLRDQKQAAHAAHQAAQAARFRDAFREVVRRNVDHATFVRWTTEAGMELDSK